MHVLHILPGLVLDLPTLSPRVPAPRNTYLQVPANKHTCMQSHVINSTPAYAITALYFIVQKHKVNYDAMKTFTALDIFLDHVHCVRLVSTDFLALILIEL